MYNVINIDSAKNVHSIEGTPVLLYGTSNLASQLGNGNVKSVPKLLHIAYLSIEICHLSAKISKLSYPT